jgi:cell division septal protein FtsQ
MDRSRRQGASGAGQPTAPPASSRLTVRKPKNRRRPGSAWSRLPKPQAIADSCGRAVRRALPVAAVTLAACWIGGAMWAGHRWVTSSPRFSITAITIDGTHRVDPAALRAALPVQVGDNVFVSLGAVARAARAHPWIAAVEVRRVLPHTLTIDVREHRAAAVAELGELYLVDASGRPFKRALLEVGEGDGLPIITGVGRAAYAANPELAAATLRAAIEAYTSWQAADRPPVGEVRVDPRGAVTLHTAGQAIAIQLGALGAGLEPRIRTFDAAWAALSDTERARARAIHLDARPDHVTVALAKD